MEDLTRDEILTICNALNYEAKHFAALAEDKTKPAHSRRIWADKARSNVDLSRKLIGVE